MPESSASSGMNGLKASRRISSGTWLSESSTSANGYSPLNRAFSMRGRPGTKTRLKPKPVVKGGSMGPSRTRTSFFPAPSKYRAKKEKGMWTPLPGRLKISQSRRLPRPPSEIVPVPMPPSGKATSLRARPSKVRTGPGRRSSSFEYGPDWEPAVRPERLRTRRMAEPNRVLR